MGEGVAFPFFVAARPRAWPGWLHICRMTKCAATSSSSLNPTKRGNRAATMIFDILQIISGILAISAFVPQIVKTIKT